jgi:hypothetical protein
MKNFLFLYILDFIEIQLGDSNWTGYGLANAQFIDYFN